MTKFKRAMQLILLAATFGIAFSFGIAVFEDARVKTVFSEFMGRANSDPTFIQQIGGVDHLFFEVPRETTRGEGNLPVFSDEAKTIPGIRGDILLTQESPFPGVPFVDWYISYFFGGHAALVTGPNRTLEATGMGSSVGEIIKSSFHNGFDNDGYFSRNIVQSANGWMRRFRGQSDPHFERFNGFFRNSFVAVRTKDRGYFDENIDIAIDYATRAYENQALYNFIFFLNTRYRYYCTDLVSRAFREVSRTTNRRVNLNQDGFITSVNDIILSSDVYITILLQTVNGIRHVYFLADPM